MNWKKISVALLAAGSLTAGAGAVASADHRDGHNPPGQSRTSTAGVSVTLCHATNSTSNPYRVITVRSRAGR